MTIEEAIRELEAKESHIRFSRLLAICKHFFGTPRIVGSHHVFKTPWLGDPRINLQRDKTNAKPYRLRMPSYLHRHLAIEAAQQSVSLNQLINLKLEAPLEPAVTSE